LEKLLDMMRMGCEVGHVVVSAGNKKSGVL